jgi:protein gp37
MSATKIEWTDRTWNPITGCDPVSPGCAHCYAKRFAERFRGTPGHPFEHGFDLQLRWERVVEPVHWRKPSKVFVCSMADLFHNQVPDYFIQDVWLTMAEAQRQTFQVLTKRPERMRDFAVGHNLWPLPNAWLGVSIENDRFAYRADILRETPAAVRWISAEPLLGPLVYRASGTAQAYRWAGLDLTGIDWLVVGGESGPGARPMHPDWVRDLRDAAKAAGTAFFFKGWGAWVHQASGEDSWGRRACDTFVERETGRTGTSQLALDLGWSAQGMWRVGKHRSGDELDGETIQEFPR